MWWRSAPRRYRVRCPVSASDLKSYWDAVYEGGDERKSWTQDRPVASLSAVAAALGGTHDAPLIDVGGGSSSLAGELLAAGYTDISVLDISPTAIELARRRLGRRAERITWIVADLL